MEPENGGMLCPATEEKRVCNTVLCTELLENASPEELALHGPEPSEVESAPTVIAAKNELTQLEKEQADIAMAYTSARTDAAEASQELESVTDVVNHARSSSEQAQHASVRAKSALNFYESQFDSFCRVDL